jgi:hypothetical protein
MYKLYLNKIKNNNYKQESDYNKFQNELQRFVRNVEDLSKIAYMDGKIKLYEFLQSELSSSGRLHKIDSFSQIKKLNETLIAKFEVISGSEIQKRVDRLI